MIERGKVYIFKNNKNMATENGGPGSINYYDGKKFIVNFFDTYGVIGTCYVGRFENQSESFDWTVIESTLTPYYRIKNKPRIEHE